MAEVKQTGNKYFSRARDKALGIVQNKERLRSLVDATKARLDDVHFEDTKLYRLGGKVRIMIRLIRAYSNGLYRELPWKSLVAMVAGIVYFLMPIDFIPDFIPVTGFLDDFTVIMLIASAFQKDLDAFIEWEQGQ